MTGIRLLVTGETLDGCWRFGILQTVDDYTAALRRGGPDRAAGVSTDEPPRTGAPQLDAGFAALDDYLAERDQWPAPAWVHDPSQRTTTAWHPAVPAIAARARTDPPQAPGPASRGRW